MDTLKWTGRKQLPLTRQTESAECGLACLVMMAWSANRLTHTARTFQYQLTRDDPAETD